MANIRVSNGFLEARLSTTTSPGSPLYREPGGGVHGPGRAARDRQETFFARDCDQDHRLIGHARPSLSLAGHAVSGEPAANRVETGRTKEVGMLDSVAIAFARLFAVLLFLTVIASTSLAAVA